MHFLDPHQEKKSANLKLKSGNLFLLKVCWLTWWEAPETQHCYSIRQKRVRWQNWRPCWLPACKRVGVGFFTSPREFRLDASLQIADGYCFNRRMSQLIFTGTNFSFEHVLGEGFLAYWIATRGLLGVGVHLKFKIIIIIIIFFSYKNYTIICLFKHYFQHYVVRKINYTKRILTVQLSSGTRKNRLRAKGKKTNTALPVFLI